MNKAAFSVKDLLGFGPTEAQDLEAVETLLSSGIRSSLPLPRELSARLVSSGGKRIRPLLVTLSYRSVQKSVGSKMARATLADMHQLASVAEWVHMATLFHDDVLDHTVERRGQSTAHVVAGNKNAILVGDFVYAEAFALLMDRGLLVPSQKLAHTVKRLVEGELIQHRVCK